MTDLDIYVFNALQRAYCQGYCDGYVSEGNNFEEVIEEKLFCEEYAKLSQNQQLIRITADQIRNVLENLDAGQDSFLDADKMLPKVEFTTETSE